MQLPFEYKKFPGVSLVILYTYIGTYTYITIFQNVVVGKKLIKYENEAQNNNNNKEKKKTKKLPALNKINVINSNVINQKLVNQRNV